MMTRDAGVSASVRRWGVVAPTATGGALPVRTGGRRRHSRLVGGSRSAVALLLLVCLVVGVGDGSAEAAPRTYWEIPYPIASPRPAWLAPSAVTVAGPGRRIDAPVGAGSVYKIRRLSWSKWGAPKVVGRGVVRYCSDTCSKALSAKIVLTRRRALFCGDGDRPALYSYTRYRLVGFPYVSDQRRFPAARIC